MQPLPLRDMVDIFMSRTFLAQSDLVLLIIEFQNKPLYLWVQERHTIHKYLFLIFIFRDVPQMASRHAKLSLQSADVANLSLIVEII